MDKAIIAAILSLILPGLGQLYQGQEQKKGIIFIVVAIILGSLNVAVTPYIGIISFLFAIYAAYDAYTYE
ncbi:MAG: hypothetical protein FWH29_05735 [Methanobrevibacter sp.]|nr:hypothetical protein [Methanobrevibacter sp.]